MLKMVKATIEQVLLERVASGWYDAEAALSLPRQLFYENPARVYGLERSER
ncbi:MAG: hypothetical protein HY321_05355 [Armatimonadetes bacterium]|nr:hypothetical protein [Armatimonadota bacterium]